MLRVTVPETEWFDETTGEFVTVKETELTLVHSLVSISKWEAKWQKPFLGGPDKTAEELFDYIKMMTITQNVDDKVFDAISVDIVRKISDYMKHSHTATTFSLRGGRKKNTEIMTSELIYFYMFHYNIPIDCQRWHINRLLTLIKVCDVKNSKDQKMSTEDIYKQNRELNEARRRKLKTRG